MLYGICNVNYSPFRIQYLHCKIFQYLDLKSLLKCSRVCKEWLLNSCQPQSICHFEISSQLICKAPNSKSLKKFLDRFGNRSTKSISVKIDYRNDSAYLTKDLSNVIKNRFSHLESIKMYIKFHCSCDSNSANATSLIVRNII